MKQKTLKHYDRMICWAKKQPINNNVKSLYMKKEIGERWFSEDCPYCHKFSLNEKKCPLGSTKIFCEHNCCDGLWNEMNNSRAWGEWIFNAEKVRQYIKENT